MTATQVERLLKASKQDSSTFQYTFWNTIENRNFDRLLSSPSGGFHNTGELFVT